MSAATYPLVGQGIRLKDAYLCANCDTVGDNASRCTHCQGGCLLSLASILDGQPRPPALRCKPRKLAAWNGVAAGASA